MRGLQALESSATGLPAWERGQTGQVGNEAALTVATSAGVRLVTFHHRHEIRPPPSRPLRPQRGVDRCRGRAGRRLRAGAPHPRRPLRAGQRAAAVGRHAPRAAAEPRQERAAPGARRSARCRSSSTRDRSAADAPIARARCAGSASAPTSRQRDATAGPSPAISSSSSASAASARRAEVAAPSLASAVLASPIASWRIRVVRRSVRV